MNAWGIWFSFLCFCSVLLTFECAMAGDMAFAAICTIMAAVCFYMVLKVVE